ncbi:MAG: hypothetical protein ACI4E5_12480 [Suilimivivens sp.]
MGNVVNKTRENVILLAMSTLPYDKETKQVSANEYEFQDKNGTYRFKGISQLEPGTKLILSMLKQEEKKVDRIVVLSTKKTCEEITGFSEENIIKLNEIAGTDFVKDSNEESDILSANNFYKKRITNYTKNEGIECPEFIFVNLEEKTFISEVVEAICGSGENEVALYVDVQGGHRPTITKMMAILELLKGRNVSVKRRIAIKYSANRSEGECHPIHFVDQEYETYELVTAMEVFRRHGSGKELKEYFDDKPGTDAELTKRLTTFIMNASEAIQTCNVGAFDKAVQQVADMGDDFNMRGANQKEEIDVVFEDIYKDYEPIITATYRYVEQIRWCLRKNYVQQAITILEAKMPKEYVTSGLKYYSWKGNKNNRQELLNYFKKLLEEKKKNNQNDIYKMKDINHYFIKDYYRDRKLIPQSSFRVCYGNYGMKDKIKANIETYQDLSSRRNHINHAASEKKVGGFYDTVYKEKEHDSKNELLNIETLKTDIEKYLRKFVELADSVPEINKRKVIDLE